MYYNYDKKDHYASNCIKSKTSPNLSNFHITN